MDNNQRRQLVEQPRSIISQGSRSKVAAGKATTATYLPQDPVDKSNKKLLENLNQALNKLPRCGQSGSRDVASSITNFGANNESTQNPLEGLGFIQTSSEKLESVSKVIFTLFLLP